MTIAYDPTLRNTMLNAITTRMGTSGKLKIFSGVRPSTGGGETTKLTEHTCSATFAPAASGGVLTINAIADATVLADGTASWFRFESSSGDKCIDGTVGTSGADMNVSTTNFVTGATVVVTSASITAGNA